MSRHRFHTIIMFLGLVTMASERLHATVPSKFVKQKDAWFRTDEGQRIADNVLTWQTAEGSWPKNGDTGTKPYDGDASTLEGTFDNGATTGELRFLARAYRLTNHVSYLAAFNRGIDLIMRAQYPTGGWPQRYPLGRGYSRHITFNDNTMVRILELLDDISQSTDFAFVDEVRRTRSQTAFDAGVQCILKCQITADGRKTVWCAQHDEFDYSPRPARAFELVSYSGGESAGILRLLMRIKNPNKELRAAIEAGVAWFERSKIEGIRIEEQKDDTVVVEDRSAPAVWARFYDIETNQPFFCGRDGVKKAKLSEIELERRTGYGWYGTWGEDVQKAYVTWQKRVNASSKR